MREIKYRAWDEYSKKMYKSLGAMAVYDEHLIYWFMNQAYVLMPFTGKHDKKDKEIYEFDIVEFKRFKEKMKGKIIFNYNTSSFEVWVTIVVGAYGEKATNQYLICHCDDIEVIGNVFENGELLNG